MAPFSKLILSVAMFLLSQATTIAQCPAVTLNAKNGNCLGTASLSLSGADSAINIVWYRNGTAVKAVDKNIYASNGITVAGGNGRGYAANQLNAPNGIYMDAVGNIFVTDVIDSNSSIKKWVPGASSGVKVAGGQGYGSTANKFYEAIDVFVDAAGNLFIADIYNHRIQKWVPGADSGITVAGGKGAGSAANQLSYPRGVFVDAGGNIFIADWLNQRIQKWAPGATSGITVAGGIGYGYGTDRLWNPTAVFVDAAGNIYIAEAENCRVLKWAPGATSGIVVAGGHGFGAAANQLNAPGDLFVDSLGNIFIADTYNHRIQKWAPGAETGITVAGGNGDGAAPNQLNYPSGVFVSATGDIFMSDLGNHRVQKSAILPSTDIDTNYMPVLAGSYTAVATYPGGCKVTSNAVFISDTTHPTITNFFPKKTRSGTWVTIRGTNFTGATSVSFGGIAADSFTIINNDTILALPGAGASGSVSVSRPCGGSASLSGFQYCSLPAPFINNSPICQGDTLRLIGADSALQITWYNNSIALSTITSFIVPDAAGSYMAIVNMPAGCTDTSNAVIVNNSSAPLISSFFPKNAGMGTSINITGANFTGANSVIIGGAAAASFTVVNDNLIKAITGAGSNGSVVVSTPCGGPGSMNGFQFCTIPTPGISTAATCLGHMLQLTNTDSAMQIAWYKNGTIINTVGKTRYANSGITVAGGSFGNGANKLNKPAGIYIDAAGNIFISDQYNHRIQKWTQGATSGITVAGGNGAGATPNQLSLPAGIYVDSTGNIFIADPWNNRIQKWPPGATSGITVAGGNVPGFAANLLNMPKDVYVDLEGNIFIVDSYNHRVQKWANGANSGITVAGGRFYGYAEYQLWTPSALFVDAAGNLFIADWSNNRIQKWTPGATYGVTVAGGNDVGIAANQLNGASSIFVDSSGNIFIADAYNNRIQKWAPGAESGITVAGGNGAGAAPNQLNYPAGVFVNATGDMFITDFNNHRVQKWAIMPEAGIDTTYKPTSTGSYYAVATFPGGCTVTSNVVIVAPCYNNYWTGAVNSFWNVPGNWSTGVVPDANTAVFINSGTVVVSADAVCYSLTVAPGANITVNPGVHLTVLH